MRTAGEPEVGLCVCPTLHTGLLYYCSVKSGKGIIPSSTETQPVLGKTPIFYIFTYPKILTYSDLGGLWTKSWLCTVLYKNERKKVILPLPTGIQDGSRIQTGTAWDQI